MKLGQVLVNQRRRHVVIRPRRVASQVSVAALVIHVVLGCRTRGARRMLGMLVMVAVAAGGAARRSTSKLLQV